MALFAGKNVFKCYCFLINRIVKFTYVYIGKYVCKDKAINLI